MTKFEFRAMRTRCFETLAETLAPWQMACQSRYEETRETDRGTPPLWGCRGVCVSAEGHCVESLLPKSLLE
jgi:hypothetical protein